jgi:hypothetical protein
MWAPADLGSTTRPAASYANPSFILFTYGCCWAGCGLFGSPGIRRTWSWGFLGLTYLVPPPFLVGVAIQ